MWQYSCYELENEGFKDPKLVAAVVFCGKNFEFKRIVTAIKPCKESLDIDAKECAEATVAMEEEENTAW